MGIGSGVLLPGKHDTNKRRAAEIASRYDLSDTPVDGVSSFTVRNLSDLMRLAGTCP